MGEAKNVDIVPTTFEAVMSSLTVCSAVLIDNGPHTKDDLDRLRWAVMALDRAATKAAANIQEGRTW